MADDDNVTPIDKGQQSKDPKQRALNKLKEATAKEFNTKVEAQVKKTVDAKKIYINEKKALMDLLADMDEANSEFSDLVKDL